MENVDGKRGVTAASPSELEVREELERILEDPLFAQSDRLGRFLRFTVEHALAGTGDSLKEYLIGVSVYDRKPPYHPSQDSIVRTEARRLRAKLKEYYATTGQGSDVVLYYRPGNYQPLFRRTNATATTDDSAGSDQSRELLAKGAGVSLAVLPFLDLSGNPLSAQCAHALTDELTHAFILTDGIRVASRAALDHALSGEWDIVRLTAKLNLECVIEGTVRVDDGRLRVSIRVVQRDGFQSSAHRFETVADPHVLSEVQDQIVSAFITRARPLQTPVRKGKASAGALAWAVYPVIVHAETMLNEGASTDIRPAMLKFQEAIEMAPQFARSCYGMSQCHIDLALHGTPGSREIVDRALATATRAVELDGEMPGCYSTLATANALAWNWKEAAELHERAAGLGVHAPSSRQYALFLAAVGRFDDGVLHLDLSQRIDPFSYRQKVAYAKFLHLASRFEDLIRSVDEDRRYGQMPVEARLLVAAAAAHLGDVKRVIDIVATIQAENQPHSQLLAGVAEVLALAGQSGRATTIVNTYGLIAEESKLSRFRQALLALSLGDKRRCLALLDAASRKREAELVWIKADPRLEPIRSSKAYEALVRKVFARA